MILSLLLNALLFGAAYAQETDPPTTETEVTSEETEDVMVIKATPPDPDVEVIITRAEILEEDPFILEEDLLKLIEASLKTSPF